jgi:hypothetical protein
LSSIELLLCSIPLVIIIDARLSTIWLSVSDTDSSSGVLFLTWMSQLSTIKLHWFFVPPAILVGLLP